MFIEYHDMTKYDAFIWNWSKNAINDDVIFISSCINFTIVDEIWCPRIEKQQVLMR
jgi:hypothetical protein